MKLFSLIFVLLFVGCNPTFAQCPDEGDATNTRLQNLNILKNREIAVQNIDKEVTLSNLLQPGDDTGRFSNNQYVSIKGWCILAKWGGAEGCNCHSKDKSTWDIHLVISTDSNQNSQDSCMIVEITRKYRALHPNLKPKDFVGHSFQIDGYLFCDSEHTRNSVNDAKEGTKDLFRKTPWEIHPVVMIIKLK